jgi:hypothetical protein
MAEIIRLFAAILELLAALIEVARPCGEYPRAAPTLLRRQPVWAGDCRLFVPYHRPACHPSTQTWPRKAGRGTG